MLSNRKLGQALIEEQIITEDQLLEAFNHQSLKNCSLKEALITLNFATENQIISALVRKFDFSFMSLRNYYFEKETIKAIPKAKCVSFKVIPVSLNNNLLTIAMGDPTNVVAMDELKRLTGYELLPVISTESDILEAIKRFYTDDLEHSMQAVARHLSVDEDEAPLELQPIEVDDDDEQDSAPVVQLVNNLIETAYRKKASDIHLEPYQDEARVRFRIDGLLRTVLKFKPRHIIPLVARVKIMSEMDIAEKRLPQDGRILYHKFNNRGLDFELRVSTIPVTYGEKAVMRILDKHSGMMSLDQLGFSPPNLAVYRDIIKRPYGMILHCGPTGSGKTTTLYAALTEINNPHVNIVTAEDPIEYMFVGINQVQVRHDLGLTFARCLRAYLRQDPNIIMVGEIRDEETARTAVEASLTGHLLFSTLHTNDAPSTVNRLLDMGIEPYLLSSSLVGVCAQRLARLLCRCKRKLVLTPEATALFGLGPEDEPNIFGPRPEGCRICGGTGYKGRMGIHELLTVTEGLQHLIHKKAPSNDIRTQALRDGMIPMYLDGLVRVRKGLLSPLDLKRVAAQD